LSIPCISSVVPSELVFDDSDDDCGADVDSAKEPIQKIVSNRSIKMLRKNILKTIFIFDLQQLTGRSAYALNIVHRLAITSVNASKTQAKLHTPCLPELNRFILPRKEATFTVIKQCVTITGTIVWTNYFNEDGDANFNVILDPPYKNMLGPGSYSIVFATKYPGGPAIHAETVCQGPVTSNSTENVGACNGYNGPDFRPVLPKVGDHVMVTGRYLIQMPEMPGGITELHPVYDIKILTPSTSANS
jgi:hypothetical protein